MAIEHADVLFRFIAWIIDIILISIISNIVFLFIRPIENFWTLPFSYINPPYWWITNSIQFAIGFLYYWLLESFNNGQTLGKMALKLRTVNEDTLQVASLKSYALNNVFKGSVLLIVDVLIGFFTSYDNDKRKIRIMQDVSKTVVIKAE